MWYTMISQIKENIVRLLFCSFLLVSCSSNVNEGLLKELDGLIESRLDIYSAYEAGLQDLKDSLALAESYDEKWKWADTLYRSYEYFSLDSTMEYVGKQKEYATTQRQKYQTAINEVMLNVYRRNEGLAEELFMDLDTAMIKDVGLIKQYYNCGIVLYSHMKGYGRHISKEMAVSKISEFRKQYLLIDSISFFAQKTLAQMARDRGDYKTSLKILDSLAIVETDIHNQALIAFNQAEIYRCLDDRDKRIEALVRSVRNDIHGAVRNYVSLYNLALLQYEERSLKRASLYISANMTDAIAAGFNTRLINAGISQMIITDAMREEEKRRVESLLVVLACILVLFVLTFVLLFNNNRYIGRLNRIKNQLLEMNSRLKEANSNLELANRIKDSYVFSYMELSIGYLRKLEDTRREVKSIAKNGGLDAVLKFLRSPSYIYDEYKQYYKVFDEAFLGIFPDFIEKVNSLLVEEARFQIPDEPVLCTELRLLAAIRLGVKESGKIATFLNCSPTTVYTYRTRLKRSAICPKEKFEDLLYSII